MSIDRIGKGGGTPGSAIIQPGSTSPEAPSKAESEFKVDKAAPADPAATGPLERLRSGEISLSQYLDIKVHEATAHLDQRLTTEQLSFIRDSLREQLSSDPLLVDLVQSATGALPPRSE
ncbi:MAG TPA: hypothetical protein VF881_03625 [Polyangiaceae bacterium]